MKLSVTCLLLALFFTTAAQNLPPVVSGLSLQRDTINGTITLNFDLNDAENDPLEVTVQFSNNGGRSFQTLDNANASGDTGFPVLTGSRTVTCTGLPVSGPGNYAFRIIADDKQPFDIQSLVNEVDSVRLRSDLEFIQGIRHRTTGLAHLNATRDSIQRLMEGQGLYFEKQLFTYTNTTGQNLIGSLPGTASADTVVIVDAHYDTVSNAPGADDNGSGTVGVMEIARLLSRYPSKKTQRYIGFDLEESGVIGSSRYVTSGIPAGEYVAGVFNFEMIGYWTNQPNTQQLPTGFGLLFPAQTQQLADNQFRGDFISNVGNTASQPLALLYSNSAQQYVPGLKVITLDVPGNGSIAPDLRRSDHAPFWDSGRMALMLSDGANFRNECYHLPSDTLDNKLNFTFMSNVVKAALAAMAQLVEVQHAGWQSAGFSVSGGSGVASVLPEGLVCAFDGEILLISSGFSTSGANIELYDLHGGLCLRSQTDIPSGSTTRVPCPGLPPGMYVLKLHTDAGGFSHKLVIAR